MASGETCGFKTTNEEIEVYVGLGDEYELDENYERIVVGRKVWGIFNRLQDCKTAKRWNKDMKYFEKCRIKIEKIEDVEI